MVAVWLDSRSRGHCVVFLDKTLYSHSASLHPGVEMGTSKLSGKLDEMLEDGGGLSSISKRNSNTPSRFVLWKPG